MAKPLDPKEVVSITEKIWMGKVVKALIQRVGEWAYDPSARLPKLTKADFQEKAGGADDGVKE